MSLFAVFPQPGTSPKLSYWPWLVQARAVLSAMGTRRHGLVGATMTAGEYELFQRSSALPAILADADNLVFNLLEDPGDDYRQMFPQREAPAEAYSDAEEANLRDRFKRICRAYEAENDQVLRARALLVAAISPEVQDTHGDPSSGFSGFSLRRIFTTMARAFAVLTSDEVMATIRLLEHPWDAGTLSAHINRQRRLHEILRVNAAPVAEIVKVGRLVESISSHRSASGSDTFGPAIQAFQLRVPLLEQRLFAAFAAEMLLVGEALEANSPSLEAVTAKIEKKSGTRVTGPAAASGADRERRRVQSGPLVFCAHHGDNPTHVTAHCQFLAKQARGGK